MALVHFRNRNNDPVRELTNEDFFLAPFFPSSIYGKTEQFPSLDVSEDASQYTVQVDVPGMKKEDISLSYNDGVLTVEGERKNEWEKKDKNFHRVERTYGRFVRTLNLGTGVDPVGIKACYKDGVLTITLPKSEKAKPKSIDIQ